MTRNKKLKNEWKRRIQKKRSKDISRRRGIVRKGHEDYKESMEREGVEFPAERTKVPEDILEKFRVAYVHTGGVTRIGVGCGVAFGMPGFATYHGRGFGKYRTSDFRKIYGYLSKLDIKKLMSLLEVYSSVEEAVKSRKLKLKVINMRPSYCEVEDNLGGKSFMFIPNEYLRENDMRRTKGVGFSARKDYKIKMNFKGKYDPLSVISHFKKEFSEFIREGDNPIYSEICSLIEKGYKRREKEKSKRQRKSLVGRLV